MGGYKNSPYIAPIAPWRVGHERQIDQARLEKLFEPVARDDATPLKINYSHLLAETDEEYEARIEVYMRQEHSVHSGGTESIRNKATSQGLELASHNVCYVAESIPGVSEILFDASKYAEKILTDEDKVRIFREDKELRLKVGSYFIQMLGDPEVSKLMPYRVRHDTEKSPNGAPGYSGLEKLRSREYVALLALSMLDGIFDPNRQEESSYDPVKDDGGGQHRWAAKKLIEEVSRR